MQVPPLIKVFTLTIFILSPRLVLAQPLKIPDPHNDKSSERFYAGKTSSAFSAATAATTGKFTIVLLPDTQFYTAEPQGTNGGTNTIFKRQIKWVINNRLQKNIVYVGQLGDCTEHGDEYEAEWKRSDTAMKLLEDSNLRFDPRYSLWYLHWQS